MGRLHELVFLLTELTCDPNLATTTILTFPAFSTLENLLKLFTSVYLQFFFLFSQHYLLHFLILFSCLFPCSFPFSFSFSFAFLLNLPRYCVPVYGESTRPELRGDLEAYNITKKRIQQSVVNFLRKLVMQVGEYFLHVPDGAKLLRIFLNFLEEKVIKDDTKSIAQFIKVSLIKRVRFFLSLFFYFIFFCILTIK